MTSVNHVALQHPAPGRFSLAELTWVWVPTQRVGKMLTACIPANRVGDLHAGEAARAGTNEPPKETSGCGGKRSERFVCQREKPAPKKPRKRAPAGNGNNKKKRRGGWPREVQFCWRGRAACSAARMGRSSAHDP